MQDLTTFVSTHLQLSVAIAFVVLFLLIVELLRAKRKSFSVQPAKATQLINHDNAVVIDVRPADTYRKGHIINAQSMPAQDINSNPKKLEKYKNRPLLIVCQAGLDSQKVAANLIKQGYNAYALAGGIRGWNAAQLPLVKE